jgi:hypothetical protein
MRRRIARRLTRAPPCGDDHGVQIPWQPQNCTRTCAWCGSSWKVPGSARRWWRGRLVSRSLARCVVIVGLLVGANQENVDDMVESISARIRLAESLRHCPECHADQFTQRASAGELPLMTGQALVGSGPHSADQTWTRRHLVSRSPQIASLRIIHHRRTLRARRAMWLTAARQKDPRNGSRIFG